MVTTEIIGEKSVIIVDCVNLKSDQAQMIVQILEQANALVAQQREKSVYIITIVSNVQFNSVVSSAFKQYAAAIRSM